MSSDLISTISARFKSGNSVPVERAHVTVDEWEQIRQAIAAHEAEQDQQAKDAARLVWAMNNMGMNNNHHAAFCRHVVNRGGTGDYSDCVTYIDAALSTTKQEEV